MTKYRHYLSFGFNCETSFALKEAGIFESSVFGWADVRGTDALLRGLEQRPDDIVRGRVRRYAGNMFFCEDAQIGFHSRLRFEKAKLPDGSYDGRMIEESLNELRQRLAHLEERQRGAFDDGSVLVVFKHFSDIFREAYTPEQSASLLADAILKRYGRSSFDVLCVTLEGKASATALDGERLFFRSLPKFSPRSSAGEIDSASWASLLSEFM